MKIISLSIILLLTLISCNLKNSEDRLNFKKLLSIIPSAENTSSILPDLEKYSKPALHLTMIDQVTFSKIGGKPDLPENFSWPAYNSKPMSFIIQLKFSEINKNGIIPELPQKGLLYVFYDQEQSTWGFNPDDKNSWYVLYLKNESDLVKEHDFPDRLDMSGIFKEKHLTSAIIKTYPPADNPQIEKLNFDDNQCELYYDFLYNAYNGKAMHILAGYPYPIQNDDMDLEAQLSSNGIDCGDSTAYKSSKAEELEPGRHDWMLLLQIDSDVETGMMWGDMGMLYFWIRKDDLKKLKFDNVWMILQCG
ncbi:MAG: DUF1963 domain-containing protein [Spirochaetes bacterium]|nr:DUF1963 domain-containing protein [Spirochaetota bacterium]